MDARVPTRSRDRAIWARHLANFGPLLVIAGAAFVLAFGRLPADAPLALRTIYGLVVALNVLVLAMASWSTVLGASICLSRRFGLGGSGLALVAPTGRARTAVLLAICEEDAASVFAAAGAIAEDVTREPIGTLDIFVLSDSRSPHAVAAEEAMLALAARAADGGPRLFYRRRDENAGRKAGNVADFVRRWGAAYDFMIVLDADSLMTGTCISRLVGAMEANPRTALIQAMCYPVGRASTFARLQQFDSRLIGPIFQRGVAFWQGPRGNFWGHNAIVRIAPFAASCGLPTLPGAPPLGGEILSHDTVEAAFLLRDGHEIWMLPDGPDGSADGSWEETPTNLLDHLERDRRWLRGNLQHVRVLAASGLKAASLYHLGRGLMHFLYAPLLVVWLGLYAAFDGRAAPDTLMLLVFALLLAPRSIGLAVASTRAQAVGFGGRARLFASTVVDQLLVSLLYPVLLVSHLVGLAGLVLGGETRWEAQARSERGLCWAEVARRLGPALGVALALLLALAPLAPLPVAILAPGLIAGLPLAVLTSRRRASARLFQIPEDARPHPLRRRKARLDASLRAGLRLDANGTTMAVPEDHGLPMPLQLLRSRGLTISRLRR